MKKEQKKAFKEYFNQFLEHFTDEEQDQEKAVKQVFNQFSDNYFYGDYKDNLQEAFSQFISDNYEPYYSDMKDVLIYAGYPATQPNGKEWPNDKIFKIWGYGVYTSFIDLLKNYNLESSILNIYRRTKREQKPFKLAL